MAGDSLQGQESTYGHCESSLDIWGTQCPSGQLVCPMWQRVLTAGQHHHEPPGWSLPSRDCPGPAPAAPKYAQMAGHLERCNGCITS